MIWKQKDTENGGGQEVNKFSKLPPELFKFIFKHLVWRCLKLESLLQQEEEAEKASK